MNSDCRSRVRVAANILAAMFAILVGHCAEAASSFDRLAIVNSNAASDHTTEIGGDYAPAIASAPNGTVVVTWGSSDFGAPGPMGWFGDAVFVRSTDNGRTWSPPEYLCPGTWGGVTRVATDGLGTWVAACRVSHSIAVVRSLDDGQTWSAPQLVSGQGNLTLTALAFDGIQSWLLGWELDDPGTFETDLYYSRSVDAGASWSPQAFGFDAPGQKNSGLRLVADGDGTWVAVWGKWGGTPYCSRSVDGGVTWTPPGSLGYLSSGGELALAYDGNGVWVVVGVGGYYDSPLAFRRSTDGGVTWSPIAPVVPDIPNHSFGHKYDPVLTVAAGGRMTAFWSFWGHPGGTKGFDGKLFSSDSFDSGATWDPPMLINATRHVDGKEPYESGTDATTTVDGRTIAVFASTNDLRDTIGNDLDILATASHDDCPPAPAVGCATTTRPRASRLYIHNGPDYADRLTWRWQKGQTILPADLGDPTTMSSYALCLYAKVGAAVVAAVEEDIPAATICDSTPCWSASGEGFAYKDPKIQWSSLTSLNLTPGEAGKGRIKLKAKGATLGPPTLPLDLSVPVKAQLLNTQTGACWEATYSTASINDVGRFSASSD